MVVLKRYHEHLGTPPLDSLIVTLKDLECRARREAATLREDLQLAGITRSVLFMKNPKVVPLRFHDWRATFVTWAFRAGKSESWISDRTGHLTTEILERYKRSAQTLSDLTYLPFPDLSNAIPELSVDAPKVIRLHR